MSRAWPSSSTTAKSSPASGTPFKPSTSTGVAGPAWLDRLAAIVEERAHAAPLAAGDEDVADLERAALDQHGGDRAAAALELRLDHHAVGGPVRDWP